MPKKPDANEVVGWKAVVVRYLISMMVGAQLNSRLKISAKYPRRWTWLKVTRFVVAMIHVHFPCPADRGLEPSNCAHVLQWTGERG